MVSTGGSASGARAQNLKSVSVLNQKVQNAYNTGNMVQREHLTLGWKPTCDCPAHISVPCTVLDPFSGSGTTGMVALQLGRDYIGIDLNAEYLEMAVRRVLGQEAPAIESEDAAEDDIFSLFGE